LAGWKDGLVVRSRVDAASLFVERLKMTKDFLAHLHPGDRVWIGNNRNPRRSIKTVVRTTSTLIVLGTSELDRYKKNGYQWTRVSNPDYISGLATPAECAEYDAKKASEDQERQQQQQERDRIEAERSRLNGLLPPTAYVSDFVNGRWSLTLENLSTSDVERMAELFLKGSE
jgi:hypothetical protein